MVTFHWEGEYNASNLFNELMAACPWLATAGEGGCGIGLQHLATGVEFSYNEAVAPPDADVQLRAVCDAHDPSVPDEGELYAADRQARLQQITNYLNGLVGLRFQDLTATQRWNLLGAFLFGQGVLNAEGVVRRYQDWRI